MSFISPNKPDPGGTLDAPDPTPPRFVRHLITFYCLAHILFLAWLFVNHVRFPLLLDLMEGTVLQHVERAAAGKFVYPEPTAEYVPLAYNVGYYLLAVPFTSVFGVNLATLRLVAILGTVISGIIVGLAVHQQTRSRWWAFVAVGLFAAAYRVMDAYLDTAHSDSWLLCSALLGTCILDRRRSLGWSLVGVAVLASAFWFKQHGAIFTIGGVLYVTFRDGWRRAMPCWVLAALLGPVSYLLLGPALFGPRYHYFTWTVPAQWSTLNPRTLYVYFGFVAISYPLLSTVAAFSWARTVIVEKGRFGAWHAQAVSAMLTGAMAAMDNGCSFNVFIPMGTWFIILGSIGLADLASSPRWRRFGAPWCALGVTLAVFVYDPRTVIMPADASSRLEEMVSTLKALGRSVYAPTLGQLPGEYRLYPAAHWVALADMSRGPFSSAITGREWVQNLLSPMQTRQPRPAILTHAPLHEQHGVQFLASEYELAADFGDRFRALRTLPGRYDHGWPRYLYLPLDDDFQVGPADSAEP